MEYKDIPLEQWLSLPERAQQELISRSRVEERFVLKQLTPRQAYRYRRRNLLSACRGWRRLRRDGLGTGICTEGLKECQRLLLAIRAEHRTLH